MNAIRVNTPLGMLVVEEKEGFLIRISFSDEVIEEKETEVLQLAKKQLSEYFEGKRNEFDLPIQLDGTDFQKEVWHILQQIPYGSTLSYQELALRIHRPKALRAVGGACHRNPIAVVVPCHRVIGKKNQLVGYASGLDKKQGLLALEKRGMLKNLSF